MRLALAIVAITLLLIPANALTINEPSFKFRVSPWLRGLAISPNGTFAVCCNSKEVVSFNTKVVWRKRIGATCLDIRGKYVAVGTGKGVYLIGDDGKIVWRRDVGAVTSVAVSSDGSVIVGGDKGVYYFNGKGKLVWKLETRSCVAVVGISKDGNVAAAEDMIGDLYIFVKCSKEVCGSKFCQNGWTWVYENGWYIGRRIGNFEYPYQLSILGNGYIVVSGGEMRTLYVFNRFGYLTSKIVLDGIPISVSASSNFDRIAVGCGNGNLYFLKGDGEVLWKINLMSPVHVSVSPDGRLVVASNGNKVVVFNGNGKILWIYDNFDDEISFVSISNTGRVVAGSLSGYVYFFKSRVKPVVDLQITPKNPKVGEKVTFRTDSIAFEFIWNFGDGKTVVTDKPVVTHVYRRSGSYTVTLTAVVDGMKNSTSRIVTVESVKIDRPKTTPKPTPTPTPKQKKGPLPIKLPKVPGFRSLAGVIAIAIGLALVRKR